MSSLDTDMRLENREAIRDVLHNYCRAIDRRDLALLESCYHADSVDQRPPFTGNGREFCVYAMRQVSRALFSQHCLSTILIDLQEDRAFVESYVHAVHRFETEGKLLDFMHYGRYCDVFELRAEKWKILHRLHLPDGDSVVNIEEPAGRSSRSLKAKRF